jgi:hypothetical protein
MTMTQLTGLLTALALAACGSQIAVKPPQTGDLAAEGVRVDGVGPPPGPEGTCWAHDLIPAIYETETEQTLVTPEVRDAAGEVVRPAAYKTISTLREVSPRRDLWFTAPCPEEMTADFLATLQRALKARGYYALALTAEMDAPTREALRRYQADRGLDSPLLSLAAARDLGLLATALDDL